MTGISDEQKEALRKQYATEQKACDAICDALRNNDQNSFLVLWHVFGGRLPKGHEEKVAWLAVSLGNLEVIRLIAPKGSYLHYSKNAEEMHLPGIAAYYGQLHIVKYLTEELKVRTTYEFPTNSLTYPKKAVKHPIYCAAQGGRWDIVTYLAEHFSIELSTFKQPFTERTLAHAVAEGPFLDHAITRSKTWGCATDVMFDKLKEKGVSFKAKDREHQTPVTLACASCNLQALAYFHQERVKAEVADDLSGNGVLRAAIRSGHLNVVNYLLLELGYIPNAVNGEQKSSFYYAAQEVEKGGYFSKSKNACEILLLLFSKYGSCAADETAYVLKAVIGNLDKIIEVVRNSPTVNLIGFTSLLDWLLDPAGIPYTHCSQTVVPKARAAYASLIARLQDQVEACKNISGPTGEKWKRGVGQLKHKVHSLRIYDARLKDALLDFVAKLPDIGIDVPELKEGQTIKVGLPGTTEEDILNAASARWALQYRDAPHNCQMRTLGKLAKNVLKAQEELLEEMRYLQKHTNNPEIDRILTWHKRIEENAKLTDSGEFDVVVLPVIEQRKKEEEKKRAAIAIKEEDKAKEVLPEKSILPNTQKAIEHAKKGEWHLLLQLDGYDPAARDEDGRGLFHYIAWLMPPDVALAEQMIDKNIPINLPDKSGQLPIHAATAVGNKEMVDFFIKNGVRPDVCDKQGRTPIFWAVYSDRPEMITHLKKYDQVDMHHKDNYGLNVLHVALEQEKYGVAKFLIDDMQLSLYEHSRNGSTAFCKAIEKGNTNIISFIFSRVEFPWPNAGTDSFKSNILSYARSDFGRMCDEALESEEKCMAMVNMRALIGLYTTDREFESTCSKLFKEPFSKIMSGYENDPKLRAMLDKIMEGVKTSHHYYESAISVADLKLKEAGYLVDEKSHDDYCGSLSIEVDDTNVSGEEMGPTSPSTA